MIKSTNKSFNDSSNIKYDENEIINTEYSNQRKSNLELLRIISMIFIISHHYVVHGNFELAQYSLSYNKLFALFLIIGGKIGVNIFILISGYFLVSSEFKLQKLFKILLQVFFYSIISIVIFYGLNIKPFDIKIAIKSIFPTTYGLYWFASSYIILYLLTPFLNVFLKKLDKTNFLQLICLLIILWSVIPTFLGRGPGFSDLSWFITLYFIAAYIKLYPHKFLDNLRRNSVVSLVSYFTILLSVVILELIGQKYSAFLNYSTYFSQMNMLPVLVCSVTLFLLFNNIYIKQSKFLNKIAASTFGIYLIHDNFLIRQFIWNDIYSNKLFFESKFFYLHAIIKISIIFIVCFIIESTRISIFDKSISNLTNRIEKNIFSSKYYIRFKSKLTSYFK